MRLFNLEQVCKSDETGNEFGSNTLLWDCSSTSRRMGSERPWSMRVGRLKKLWASKRTLLSAIRDALRLGPGWAARTYPVSHAVPLSMNIN